MQFPQSNYRRRLTLNFKTCSVLLSLDTVYDALPDPYPSGCIFFFKVHRSAPPVPESELTMCAEVAFTDATWDFDKIAAVDAPAAGSGGRGLRAVSAPLWLSTDEVTHGQPNDRACRNWLGDQ